MYSNIGGKIRKFAAVLAILGIIGSAIGAIIAWSVHAGFMSGLLILTIGGLSSWIGSWAMYAFGTLVEDTAVAREEAYRIRRLLSRE